MSASVPSPVEATPSPVSNSGKAMKPVAKLGLIGLGCVVGLGVAFLPGGSRNKADTKAAPGEERPGDVGRRFDAWEDRSGQGQAQGQGAAGPPVGAQLQAAMAKALAESLGNQGRSRRVAPASIVGYEAPRQTAGAGSQAPSTPSGLAKAAAEGDPAALPVAGGAGGASRAGGGAGAGGWGGTDTVAGMQVLRASRLPQPALWLMPGDKLKCDQNEPLVGIEGAPFTCVLSADVKGRTGNVTLLYKGARLVGTVVRGLDTGEERLGVSFNHAEDAIRPGEPDPIVVPLNSPGADVAGQAGLDGHVRTFFWQKLGATAAYALLDLATQGLSVGAGVALGSALGGGRNSAVNVLNLGSQGRSLAQSEFGEQANRKPQFTRNPGEPLMVFITHPIWFGDAVALRLRGGR